MISVATKHPNVYIDTSAYTVRRYPPGFITYLKAHGRHKVLFGTNWPMIAPRKALEGLANLALSVDGEAALLGGNAARVYRLAAATTVNQANHQQTETH
jgi:predicted TIM-barrel fold metal-dependent hydrolase